MNIFYLTPLRRTGLVAVAALMLNACAPAQDTPTPTTSVNVSRYVAVGDSYTAGVSAGGLTRTSQEYSFPNLIARQLQGASANAAFTQPLLEAGTGSGYFDLVDYPASGIPRTRRIAGQAVRRTVINPTACGGPDTVRLLERSKTASALPQNLGVPGLLLSQIETAGLGNETKATPGGAFNPYFERLLPAADSRTYLQAVTDAAATATFFTYFQGLDDLLPYVRSGGECGPFPNTSLTNLMKANARKVLDRLRAGGQPGIIAKLPALNTLPLLRLGKGLQLQARLQALNNDKALLYIEDPINLGPAQPITDDDYVLATAIPRVGKLTPVLVGTTTLMLPYGRDARNPLRDADVLDNFQELQRAKSVLDAYNNELENLAHNVYRLPEVDITNHRSALDLDGILFNNVADIISVNGVVYSSEPVRGNFFSLDYYSLTPRGNGLVANAFISAINKAYRANIPAVDVNNLPTVAH
ncbi:hypothetical protein Q3A66_06510 [Hymenobacter sp. BT770]|uniref:hypothetical protein n=1 Tax=Hymenobacter sp. BT770 TaxID=2886942 RepID=UPI001D11C9F6|nr:hypothetical protein [Hymenobacter sp. BT770]MCC3152642.1 hypothetical protein [Hymenobacter sp. BT770]MDO3414715.1 hypothetical protein [Hymenobacter sp. BT770]